MCELAQSSRPVDLVTLHGVFASHLDQIGGATYLASLTDVIASPTWAKSWVQIVAEKAKARRLIETATTLAAAAYDGQNIDQLVDEFGKIFIKSNRAANKAFSASLIADLTLGNIKGSRRWRNLLSGHFNGLL